MMRKTCFICAAIFVSALFSAVCGLSAEETSDEKEKENETKQEKAPFVLKMKNPYERDASKIAEMVKKQKLMPVGRKRDLQDAKIVLEQKKLDEKMKKNVASIKHSLERLERQHERTNEEAKKKELGIKINKMRAEIALHEAWCSGDPDALQDALELAEKAFSPNATGKLSEEEEDEKEDSEEAEKDKKKDKKDDGKKKEDEGEDAKDKNEGKDDSVKKDDTKDEAKEENAKKDETKDEKKEETGSDDSKKKPDPADKSSEKETKGKKSTKTKKSGKNADSESDASGKKKTKKNKKNKK